MSNYGGGPYPAPQTYDGTTTYEPTTNEQLSAIQGQLGAYGNATGNLGQAIYPISRQASGGVQILGGVVQTVAGALVTFGTDGAGAAAGIPIALNGITSIINGVNTIQGNQQEPIVAPYQPPQLPTFQPPTLPPYWPRPAPAPAPAPSPTDNAAAVWNFDSPVFGYPEKQMMDFLVSNLRLVPGSSGAETPWFRLQNAPTALGATPGHVPDIDWTNIDPTWTLQQALQHFNGWASVVANGPTGTWLLNDTDGSGWVSVVDEYMYDRILDSYYVPSSGGPKRSLLGDLKILLALIPVRYSD